MLTILELRGLAKALDVERFERQVGPFALVQRPPKSLAALAAARMGVGSTLPFNRGSKQQAARAIELVMSFDSLEIATLPPVKDQEELFVGRLPDCDLVIENPSVSKRHAALGWDAAGRMAKVRDLGSRNGTRVDGRPVTGEAPVRDEEVVSFGDVDYWFLLSPTLYRRLLQAVPAGP